MASTTIRKLQALGLAAALVLDNALPSRRHPLTQALLAAALVAITKAPLGFRPPALWSGLRVGSAAAWVVTVAVAAGPALARDVARTADIGGHRLAGGSRLPGRADDSGRGRLRPADRPAGAGDRVR